MHKNATGLLHSSAGFPPHPPCCAVRLTDPSRNAYECTPDGHKSLVDAPLEAPAAGAAASPVAATGNASNRAAWAARIGEGAAAIVEAGGDVFDTIPAHGFPDPGYKNPCWCVRILLCGDGVACERMLCACDLLIRRPLSL